jgi:tetratricopeptide (TPR) repeat protein
MRANHFVIPTAAVAVVAAVAVAVAIAWRPGAPATRSALYPDPDVARYRYPLAQPATAGPDRDTLIRELEARAGQPSPSPLDLADLAALHLERAHATGDAHDYASAETFARRSLDILPSPNPALLTLAHVANARHDFRAAIELAGRALAQRRSAAAYVVLATAQVALGELDDAARAADAAVALRPTSSAYLTRALVHEAAGRDTEAASDFTRAAVVEDHGNPAGAARLRGLWGRFLLRRGELAGAELLLRESLRIDPDNPLATGVLGELALRRGDTQRAIALFERAFYHSSQVRYLIDEARARQLAGNPAAADALRAQVIRIARADLEAGALGHRLDLVEALVDRGRPGDLADAIRIARDEVSRRPIDPARFQLARALACSSEHDAALAQLRPALATGAARAEHFELAAWLERRAGDRDSAARYAELADRLDPTAADWRRLVHCG